MKLVQNFNAPLFKNIISAPGSGIVQKKQNTPARRQNGTLTVSKLNRHVLNVSWAVVLVHSRVKAVLRPKYWPLFEMQIYGGIDSKAVAGGCAGWRDIGPRRRGALPSRVVLTLLAVSFDASGFERVCKLVAKRANTVKQPKTVRVQRYRRVDGRRDRPRRTPPTLRG